MKTLKTSLGVIITGAALALLAVACSDDNSTVTETPQHDAGTSPDSTVPGTDGGMITPSPDGSTPGPDGSVVMDDCVKNPDPNVYTDILNACTTSYKVDPKPVLPLLYPDGGLPPLP